MLVNTMTVPAIQDLVKKSFIASVYGGQPDTVREVFLPETSDFSVNAKRIQEVDRERFAERKGEGQGSAQRGMGQGYYKDIPRSTISVTRKVSGEDYQALQAHKLAEYAMAVGKDVVDKIELDMRNFLGIATVATSYTDNGGYTIDLTVGDGFAVFYTAHTLKNSSTTYSNILSGNPVLTNQALETAEDYFSYNVLDNYGQRMSIKPNTIITSRKAIMANRVARILRSESPESIAGTANANAGIFNTYKNKYRHIQIEFDVDAFNVTDTAKSYYWFLAALGGMPEDSFQAYYVRWLSPTVAPAEVDQDKWILSFTARACYGLGAVSGRGICVSKATS